MSAELSIPQPCHEDWNNMTPREQGRHCASCCKTVVDFSSRSNEEIVDFLKANASHRICGRFRSEQLKPHAAKPAKRYRLFLAALVFVFSGALFTSCKSHAHDQIMGKVEMVNTPPENQMVTSVPQPDTTQKTVTKKPVVPDTTEPEVFKMGEVVIFHDTIH